MRSSQMSWSYITSKGPWRPEDAEVEVGSQRLANAEAEVKRPADARGQRSEGQRDPKSESRGPRPAELRPELEDK